MAFARESSERLVVTLPPEASALDAATIMAERHVGAVIVVDGERRPRGIVTDRDLAIRILAARLDPASTPLSQVMTRDLVTARDDSADVATLMALKGVRRVPLVAADGKLTGMVTLDDMLAVHAHRIHCLAQAVAHEQAQENARVRSTT
jgi:CBS domain-containing protein